ncbi:hypothetical protein MTBUT4_500023 [Magnetospirillum sp. UT-4]|nr:hypothetical protein MTBUT4_500023 [Magnetospirillum sp. UT-4]
MPSKGLEILTNTRRRGNAFAGTLSPGDVRMDCAGN